MVETRKTVMASVPALTLHPPEIARLLKKCISILISMLIPPPDPLLDARHRLCSSEHRKLEGYEFPVYSTEFCPRNRDTRLKSTEEIFMMRKTLYHCMNVSMIGRDSTKKTMQHESPEQKATDRNFLDR
uniref:Uncharacterized protein n=1 Tax=Magallana gigas TaxID=29159 RepID=K1QCY4_MAGGI